MYALILFNVAALAQQHGQHICIPSWHPLPELQWSLWPTSSKHRLDPFAQMKLKLDKYSKLSYI
jgi:hypothetical protein